MKVYLVSSSHFKFKLFLVCIVTYCFTRHSFSLLHFLYFVQDTESAGKKASSRVKSRVPATDDSEPSQSDTITYDDPAGRMEREKIIAQLKRGASPSTDCNTEEDEENRQDCNTLRKVSCTLSQASVRLVQGPIIYSCYCFHSDISVKKARCFS